MQLQRYPVRKNEMLLAQDSADVLLINYIKSQDLIDKKILIINDHFGAISCALEKFHSTTYTDSFVSFKATELNSQGRITPLRSFSNISGTYDYVLIQIPKNMSYFEDILAHLTLHLHSKSQVICGSMVKHLSPTSFDLLQKYIGDTTTSLAEKKARLIFATFEKSPKDSPFPLSIKFEGFENPFLNHSNLFSRDKLDIGTRFFLEHIPQGPFEKILDLGCANGVIGIKAKQLNSSSHIIFSDESYMAIQSAEENYSQYFKDGAEFVWNNCYENRTKDELDLILCNPPFHQGTTVGDFIAWQMFTDSHACLRPGGILRVIGNSHLGYQIKLKKIFGNSKIIATNKKFIICESTKN